MKYRQIIGLSVLLAGVPCLEAQAPAWWAAKGVTNSQVENNKGPANIGQAKHMVKQALAALRDVNSQAADAVEAEVLQLLGSEGLTPPANPDAAWYETQKGVLLNGQLKALAKPFYDELNTLDASSLESERIRLGTNITGSIYPWTGTSSDDSHFSPATLGQLKACFGLDLALFSGAASPGFAGNGDSDQDGLSDAAEIAAGTNPQLADTDGDGRPDGIEKAFGDDPLDPNSPPAGTPPRAKWMIVRKYQDYFYDTSQFNPSSLGLGYATSEEGWTSIPISAPRTYQSLNQSLSDFGDFENGFELSRAAEAWSYSFSEDWRNNDYATNYLDRTTKISNGELVRESVRSYHATWAVIVDSPSAESREFRGIHGVVENSDSEYEYEVINFTVPAGSFVSNTFSAEPAIGEFTINSNEFATTLRTDGPSVHHEFYPLKVDMVIGGFYKNVTELGIQSSQSNEQLNVETNPSRFYLEFQNWEHHWFGATGDEMSFFVGTSDNPVSSFNDDQTEVEQEVARGGLLLVGGDALDDIAVNDIGPDDQKNDRTHKGQSGGNLLISKITIGGVDYPLNLRIPIQ